MQPIQIVRRVNQKWSRIGEILVSDKDHRDLNFIQYLTVDEFFTLTDEFKAHPLPCQRKMQRLVDSVVDRIIEMTDVAREMNRASKSIKLLDYVH